nr:MAG TPA: RNA ligase [Caudoviricetes sp.]
MKLKVLELINNNENWERILSSPPYNLIIKWKEPFVLLKYNQLSSDMNEEICQECRGIILKKTTDGFKVASMKFKKFFNYGEDKAAKLDFSKPVIVSQKVDGSLLSIWYDEDTGWHVSTSGNIDSRDAELQFKTDKLHTYYDLFMEAFNKYHLNFDMFDKNYTIYYELVSPYNRVVVPYRETKLYWLGARDNNTLEEYSFEDMLGCYTNIPKWHKCSNLEEIISSVKNLTTEDEHFEGFVVQDWKGNRIKLKSPSYIHLFFIKGDGIFSEKKILKIILEEEDDDILSYFPEYKPDFDRIRRLLSIYITNVKESLEEANNRLILARKEYSRWASKQINPYILFKFYDNYDNFNLREIIESIPLEKLLDNIKKGE